MKVIKKVLVSASMLAMFVSIAQADLAVAGGDKVDQLKILLQQVQDEMNAASQRYVYLGNEQIKQKGSNQSVLNLMAMLSTALDSYSASAPKDYIPGLKWLPAAAGKLPAEPLLNAGLPEEPVNICRAPFLGVAGGNGAMYPGQLTAAGCRISYAGYAFIVTKFSVLSGDSADMQWVPIATVNASLKSQQKKPAPAPASQSLGTMFMVMPYEPAYYSVKINGGLAVSGGYDQRGPVLLCRAKQNGHLIVGKLVTAFGLNGTTDGICDVGVDNKEVTVREDFDLLFWK